MKQREAPPPAPSPAALQKAVLAAVLAWLVPGGGHFLLKRWGRGAIFFGLVIFSLVIGCYLEGRLPWYWSGSPLRILATLGSMGSGAAYFVLRVAMDYTGDIRAAGYEYGSAFILTAGLMNVLLAIDAWDIALDRKE